VVDSKLGAAATSINMVSVVGNQHPTTSILNNNARGHNKRGIATGQPFTTTTVTGSLVQKPVTAAEGNQGSCDKNPDKAASTADTDAIVEKNGGGKECWVDPRNNGATHAGRRKNGKS
jgi:hypothetical protein